MVQASRECTVSRSRAAVGLLLLGFATWPMIGCANNDLANAPDGSSGGGSVSSAGGTSGQPDTSTGGTTSASGSGAGGAAVSQSGGTASVGGSTASSGGIVGTGGTTQITTGARGGTTGSGSASGGASPGGAAGRGLTLYYVRHAQVVANTLDPSQVTYENSETLTDLGLLQIGELTTYLKGLNLNPDAVLVSPFRRAQKTIEPYLVAKNISGVIWMELAECCTQTPTGGAIPTQPTFATFRATIEAGNMAFRDPNATKFWQNDTYEAGLLMVTTVKNDILSQFSQSGKTIMVVGHASAGSLLLNIMRGVDVSGGTSSPNALYMMNTGVQRLIQDPATGTFKLDGRNLNNPRTE